MLEHWNSDYISAFFLFYFLSWEQSNVGRVPRKTVESPSLEVFRTRLGRALRNNLFWAGLDWMTYGCFLHHGKGQSKEIKHKRNKDLCLDHAAAAHQWGKAQPNKRDKGRVKGFAAMASFTTAGGVCTHLQLFESFCNLLSTRNDFYFSDMRRSFSLSRSGLIYIPHTFTSSQLSQQYSFHKQNVLSIQEAPANSEPWTAVQAFSTCYTSFVWNCTGDKGQDTIFKVLRNLDCLENTESFTVKTTYVPLPTFRKCETPSFRRTKSEDWESTSQQLQVTMNLDLNTKHVSLTLPSQT